MQIQTRVENPRGPRRDVSELAPHTAPLVITSISDLTWSVFVQRRRQAQMRRRAFESLLFPNG